jgi:carbamoyltransferase
MIILGLNHGEFNSSAAVVKDGILEAASPEERFIREKKTKKFPKNASKFCLDHLKIELSDCDFIAQAWNPGDHWQKHNPLISDFRTRREDYFYTVPDNLYNLTERKVPKWVKTNFSDDTKMPSIYYIRHHLTHAANAFFLSPFEESAILTCDWRGEFESTTMGIGKNNTIDILASKKIPHSLGMFYAAFTQLLGYRVDNDEWKVMALSAFECEYNDLLEKIRTTIKLTDDGFFELDESYYQGALVDKPKVYTEKLVELLGGKEGQPGESPTNWHYSVAKAMQLVSEEIVFHMLKHLYDETKLPNLVLGGGFFMNSVCNGKISKNTPFENIYVSHSPADVGNSIGAALYVAHCIHNEKRIFTKNSSFLGPEFSNLDVENSLKRRKLNYELIENIDEKIAELLANGNVVAFSNGRMEFGERALGNRSILGDPRDKEIKNKINSIIKYRENYRPFAPAVLSEKAQEYFDIPENFECNYMEKVVPVKDAYRKELPGITHVDGSGRIQTVSKFDNPVFHSIIEKFEKITGYPIVLNTSFNINGEPIVLTPDDAINTFFNSGLEFLVINNYIIQKQ